MQKLTYLLSFYFLCFNLQAQSPKNKLGTWYMYNGTHEVSKKIALKTSAHFRYFDFGDTYQQEVYRTGLNYSFHKKINTTLGGVYSVTDNTYKSAGFNLKEYRLYQDLNIKGSLKKLSLKHRVRLAQRFTKQNTRKKTKHRIRYGLFFKYPIFKKWKAYAFNETFIKFATKSFGQNRIGTGIIRKINKNFKLKVGYLNIKSSTNTINRLQLGILVNTNHIKKIS